MPNESQKGGGWWDTYGDDMMSAAMIYWMQQQQNNRDNRAPQMTPVPLTPEQQWRFDRGRELFNYSPMRDYVGQYSHQFLQGLNGPNGLSAPGQNHRWLSPNMQGQSFAGGIQFPRVDMSNLPQYWGNNRPAQPGQPGQPQGGPPARPGQPGGGVSGGGGFQPNGPVGNGRLNDIGGTGDPFPTDARMPERWGDRNVITPGNYPGVTDPNTRNPFLNPGNPGGGGGNGAATPSPNSGHNITDPDAMNALFNPQAPPQGVERGVWQTIVDGWNRFRASTPNWMDLGIGMIVGGIVAAAGAPQLAPIVGRVVSGALGPPKPPATAPPQGGGGSGFVDGSVRGAGFGKSASMDPQARGILEQWMARNGGGR